MTLNYSYVIHSSFVTFLQQALILESGHLGADVLQCVEEAEDTEFEFVVVVVICLDAQHSPKCVILRSVDQSLNLKVQRFFYGVNIDN